MLQADGETKRSSGNLLYKWRSTYRFRNDNDGQQAEATEHTDRLPVRQDSDGVPGARGVYPTAGPASHHGRPETLHGDQQYVWITEISRETQPTESPATP